MAEVKGFNSWTNIHKAQYIKGPKCCLHLFHPKEKWAAVIPICCFATFHSSVSINPKGFCIYIEADTSCEISKHFCLPHHTITCFLSPFSILFSNFCCVSQTHRMIKAEQSSGGDLIQIPCSNQVIQSWLPKSMPRCLLNKYIYIV